MLVGTLTVTDTGAADIHPVGYYTLLWGWMKIFGESLLATRLLSVFIGVGIVFLGYFIMRYLFNEKAAFWAAFFLAISPFQIHYSQEIRMYALMTFWLLIALYAFLKGVLDESWTWLGIFSLSAALAQYTHHLAAFFLLPLSVTAFFFRGRKGVLRAIIGGCVAIILYLPWLIHLPSQLSKVQTSYWVPKPGVRYCFIELRYKFASV